MNASFASICLLLLPCLVTAADPTEELLTQSKEWLHRGELNRARDGFESVWREFAERGDPRARETGVYYGHLLAVTGYPQKAMNVLGPLAKGNDRDALVARSCFAICLRLSGETKRGAQVLKKVLRDYPRETSADLVQAAQLYAELATMYGTLRKFRDSEAAAREAVRLTFEGGERYRRYRTPCLVVLAQAQLDRQRDEEAEATLTRAREHRAPDALRESALIEGITGTIALRRGRLEEAERRFRKSLGLLTELVGPEHYETGVATKHLATVLNRAKRDGEARAMEARADAILEQRRKPSKTVSVWALREVE